MNFQKDYYEVLGVPATANKRELKLARNTLARKYHSDLQEGALKTENEERMREVNEAYEVLSDDVRRQVYDEYKKRERTSAETKSHTDSPGPKKRTVTRKYKESVERKIYVKGKIQVKYYGPQSERLSYGFLSDTYYRIIPKEVQTWIDEKDIYTEQKAPFEFAEAFKNHKPLDVVLPQPIPCFIMKNGKERPYNLYVNELTIPEPVFENITKHENETFGTLSGTFYGYMREVTEEEREVETTEFYGETGKYEEHTEGGTTSRRTEYFHSDGSTFWGPWVPHPKRPSTGFRSAGFNRRPAMRVRRSVAAGCFAPGCIASLGSLFGYLYLALIAFVWLRVILAFLVAAFSSDSRTVSDRSPRTADVRQTPPPKQTTRHNSRKGDNSVISHYLSWTDYDGKPHQGRVWVKRSWFEQSGQYKAGLNLEAVDQHSYDEVVYSLKENDRDHLAGFYALFDSLRLADHPDERAFAEDIVSCVQSIPYALILPKDCNPDLYEDEFTRDYLNSPNALCLGEQRYGINSPVEFVATLKGDCDTRSLLLYTILSHYGYDAVLLSSEYYSHSLIGVNLPYYGVSLEDGLSRYVFWETTAKDVRPGFVPDKVSDPAYWRISLKSQP